MSWTITPEDIASVLDSHGIEISEDHLDELAEDLDNDNASVYPETDHQVDQMLGSIENYLLRKGVIPSGSKKQY